MRTTTRSAILRYGFVFLAVAVALLLRFALWPLLGSDVPFLLLWPAVMGCAWYGGVGPGLLATLLSALGRLVLLLEPQYSLAVAKPADVTAIILYLLLGAALSTLIEAIHRAKRQVEQHALEPSQPTRVVPRHSGQHRRCRDCHGSRRTVAFMNDNRSAADRMDSRTRQGPTVGKGSANRQRRNAGCGGQSGPQGLENRGIVGLANHTVL